MAETLTMVSERVAAMPVLLAHLARLGLQPLVDEHVPTHGNGVGLRLGWVSVLWLTPMLSEGDHRLNHVAPLGHTAAAHAAGVPRAVGPPLGCQRRPSGHGAGGLE
jgi:hypothetical protein